MQPWLDTKRTRIIEMVMLQTLISKLVRNTLDTSQMFKKKQYPQTKLPCDYVADEISRSRIIVATRKTRKIFSSLFSISYINYIMSREKR